MTCNIIIKITLNVQSIRNYIPSNHRNLLKFQQAGIGIEVNRPGAGAPNVDEHGNLKVKKAQTLTKSYTGGNNKNN